MEDKLKAVLEHHLIHGSINMSLLLVADYYDQPQQAMQRGFFHLGLADVFS